MTREGIDNLSKALAGQHVEIADLRGEIERLTYALIFYADKTNYVQRGWQGDPMPSWVDEDRGEVARAALEPKP